MENISYSTLEYMVQGIKYVCKNYKNRSAGSDSERNCQRYFKSQLEKWADNVEEETFRLHPKAFLGWLPISGLLDILSVVMFWLRIESNAVLFPAIGAVAVSFSVLLYVVEFILYRPFIDRLFPKAVSTNILARRAPKGELKSRIIFGGHADAAYEMRYSLYAHGKGVVAVTVGWTLGMLVVFFSNVTLLVQTILTGQVPVTGLWRVIGFIEIAFIPFFIAAVFFTNWRRVVDGANDNLSGCFVAMSVLKQMAEEGLRLEHTEVCCLITGGEESGLRGALAYSEKHKKEFLNSDVGTIFIALDTMREIEQLQIYTKGQNGLQKNSESVGELLRRSGRACSLILPEASLYPGATDAEGFSRNGIKSCGLCGVDHKPQAYYHTRYDTWNNISQECLKKSLQICMEASRLFDRSPGLFC